MVTCDTGAIDGMTSDPASDSVDLQKDFQEPCSIQPVGLNATFDCNNGESMRLRAVDPVNDTGEIDELLPGYQCTVVVTGICTLTSLCGPTPGGVGFLSAVFELSEAIEFDP